MQCHAAGSIGSGIRIELSFNFPRIFRSRGTWTRLVQSRAIDKGCENPESASPDCFSLLPPPSLRVLEIFLCSSLSLSLSLSPSLFRASAFQPPFQVAPALKYRARRSWISGAGVSAAKLSCCLVTKSRELPRILRAAIRSFVRAFHFVQLRATKSDVYRTPAYARLQLVSIDSTGTRHEPKLVSDNSL